MFKTTDLLCWFLATVFQVLSINNPDMSGDTAKFGLAGWRNSDFLSTEANRAAWARWVDAKIVAQGDPRTPADVGESALVHLSDTCLVKVRPGGVEATQQVEAGVLEDGMTLAGEIWKVMAGVYADSGAAERAWLGTDYCRGNNPPAIVKAIIRKVIKELLPGMSNGLSAVYGEVI